MGKVIAYEIGKDSAMHADIGKATATLLALYDAGVDSGLQDPDEPLVLKLETLKESFEISVTRLGVISPIV